MTLSEFAGRFFTVRRCICCGEAVDYERRDNAFCEKCYEKWEKAKMCECGICHKPMADCTCMPDTLSASGTVILSKLVDYKSSESAAPQNKIIYYAKRNRNIRVFSFLAGQLLPQLNALLAESDASADEAILVPMPRGNRARINYGFDQSEMICRALSEKSGVKYMELFKHRSGREQKKMNAAERKKNVGNAYAVKNEVTPDLIVGKVIILFDDVVTTGASMSECAKAVMSLHPELVVGLCIAITEKINKK